MQYRYFIRRDNCSRIVNAMRSHGMAKHDDDDGKSKKLRTLLARGRVQRHRDTKESGAEGRRIQ